MGLFSNLRQSAVDAYTELKDAVVHGAEANDDLVNMPTPEDRWFTPVLGWPSMPAKLPDKAIPAGYTVQDWSPPKALCPTAVDVKELFDARFAREQIGELCVEVLEAEGLPNSLLRAPRDDSNAGRADR